MFRLNKAKLACIQMSILKCLACLGYQLMVEFCSQDDNFLYASNRCIKHETQPITSGLAIMSVAHMPFSNIMQPPLILSFTWFALRCLVGKSPTSPPLFGCSCTRYFHQNPSYILHWLLNEHAIWSVWPTIYETQKMIVLHVASISNLGKSCFWFIRCLMGNMWIICSRTIGTPRCQF